MWLVTLQVGDQAIVGAAGAVYLALLAAIRTLYRDKEKLAERKDRLLSEMAIALQDLTAEVRKAAQDK